MLIDSTVATRVFKIPLGVVQFAFLKMEHERDVNEIECLLANLIFKASERTRRFCRLLLCARVHVCPRQLV